MAHFARLVEGMVVQVVVVDNKDCAGGAFPGSEIVGQQFLFNLGQGSGWLQCSYNNKFRDWYPFTGWTYNSAKDIFVCPQPSSDCTYDQATNQWVAPNGLRIPKK